MDIYKQQKYTFKLTVEFSFLRVKIDYDDFKITKIIPVEFGLMLASTNTRPEGFKNPVVVDNKKDIDKVINKLTDLNLVEYLCKRVLAVNGSFTDF